MSTGPKVPAAMRQAGDILRILAGKMPDQVLQEWFPDRSPARIRQVLRQAAAVLGPVEKEPTPRAHQAKLWQDSAKDWQGKLQGTTVSLYTDGASRGNPGEAGAGIAIVDEQGQELAAIGRYLGQCTNNEAEYRALLYGLARCREFGRGRLKVYLDSELIVKQLRGEYRVKHPNLKPLFHEVQAGLSDFDSWSVSHVRREKNRRADELANRAIDEHIH